jgi:hypothetical protein
MIDDPIVKEVSKIRHEIDQEYQRDPEKYFEHLKTLQKKYADRLVCRHYETRGRC